MNNNKIDINNHNVLGDNYVNLGGDNKNSNEKKKDSFIIKFPKFIKYIWKLGKNILKFLF